MRVDRRKRRQKSGFIGLCVKTFLCKCFSVCVAFVCATSICVWIKELCLKDFVCTSFCVQPSVKASCVNAFVCKGEIAWKCVSVKAFARKSVRVQKRLCVESDCVKASICKLLPAEGSKSCVHKRLCGKRLRVKALLCTSVCMPKAFVCLSNVCVEGSMWKVLRKKSLCVKSSV